MGRLPRAIDDGLVYHALNRGNNRAAVFADDEDHLAFLQALAGAKERYPFRLLGYCLMTNHFHLLLRPEPGQSISRILQSLTVAHTWRYHRRHRTSGHVWQGRFKSPVIQDDMHLLVVLRYIEANPLRARMVADPAEYRWSSFPHHGLGQDDPLLSPFPEWEELGRTEAERRRRWRAKVRAVQGESELDAVRRSLGSGRPYGAAEWTERMAERLGIDLTPRPRGRPRKEKMN
jgi:putative transposase